jgi:amino acid transporter
MADKHQEAGVARDAPPEFDAPPDFEKGDFETRDGDVNLRKDQREQDFMTRNGLNLRSFARRMHLPPPPVLLHIL